MLATLAQPQRTAPFSDFRGGRPCLDDTDTDNDNDNDNDNEIRFIAKSTWVHIDLHLARKPSVAIKHGSLFHGVKHRFFYRKGGMGKGQRPKPEGALEKNGWRVVQGAV